MKLEPLHDFIVLRIEKDTHTPGGLHIPGRAQESQNKAIIVALGPDVRSTVLAVGDRVFVIKTPESQIGETDVTGEKLVMCREGDLVARVVAELGDSAIIRPSALVSMPTDGSA